MTQEGDVLLFQTNDDGEISIVDGVVEMTAGFETAVYLSLFGGNSDDDGLPGNKNNWWGNLGENDPAKQYRSKTQYLLDNIAPNSANIVRIKDAANNDLGWMKSQKIATAIEVLVSIPKKNYVRIDVVIEGDGRKVPIKFLRNWQVAA